MKFVVFFFMVFSFAAKSIEEHYDHLKNNLCLFDSEHFISQILLMSFAQPIAYLGHVISK